MGAGKVVFLDPDMTAAAELGNGLLIRNAEKTARGAHCHDHIGRITAMAVVAGDAVSGMNALSPGRDRCSEAAHLPSVALDTHRLRCFCRRRYRKKEHKERPDSYNQSE